jgi:O-6-methylguanine DNA methyltransferase
VRDRLELDRRHRRLAARGEHRVVAAKGGATLRRQPRKSAAGAVAAAVAAIVRLLAGEQVDLRGVALDNAGIAEFDRRVYAVTREIEAGRVLTYGEVAARVGADASARAVGESLGRNAMPIVVPCHRVVATGGPRRLLGARRGANEAAPAGDRERPARRGRRDSSMRAGRRRP